MQAWSTKTSVVHSHLCFRPGGLSQVDTAGVASPAAGLQVGSGTPGHSPASTGIYVVGQSEFDGTVYFDSILSGGTYQSPTLDGDHYWTLGSGGAQIGGNHNGSTYVGSLIVDGTNNQWVIGSTTSDYDHANQSNPTLFLHSDTDPDTDNAQWLGFTHQAGSATAQLSASIFTEKSDIKFSPSGSDVMFVSGSGDVYLNQSPIKTWGVGVAGINP